jgi:tRNA dimethylallyltransferase
LALRLADMLAQAGRDAVIVNADSVQVYRDIPILAAAPDAGELGQVPHRLYGAWDGAMACSAADWAASARAEIDEAHRTGMVPILCGGTGLYLRTLLEGIAPVPAIDPLVREQVRGLAQDAAREALEREDPQAAARLAPADTARTMRALEVVRSTRHRLADWQARKHGGIADRIALHPLVLLPDREWLYQRCDRRFAQMVDGGAVEEVEALLARRLDPALPVMRAIGVREVAAWLKGDLGRDEAIAAGQIATRQYAKRQYTWFRHQPPADWHRVGNENVLNSGYFVSLLRKMG